MLTTRGVSPSNAVVGIEAVLEILAVLVGGVLGQHLAAGGALERLEACLALDGEGGGILRRVSGDDLVRVFQGVTEY